MNVLHWKSGDMGTHSQIDIAEEATFRRIENRDRRCSDLLRETFDDRGQQRYGRPDHCIDFNAQRSYPGEVSVRLRHPGSKKIQTVTVNGRSWTDFDSAKEWVRIPQATELRYTVIASY